MEEIRRARPELQPSADEWVRSERGQQVLQRVLANADGTASRRRRGAAVESGPESVSSHRGYWWIGIAAALVVVALGVSLGVGLADRGRDSSTVVESNGTVAIVTRSAAVQNVVLLVFTTLGWSAESVDMDEVSEAKLLSVALEKGLIGAGDLDDGGAVEPMLEGEYALLLWRAFGTYFPITDDTTTTTAEGIDPRVAGAVTGLQTVGVLCDSDGQFDPERPLEVEREQLLLDRMESALLGETPE